MKYIVYKKQDNKVLHILDKEPVAISEVLGLARCETVPQGDILTVVNLQAKTEKYTVKEPKEVVKIDEQGNEYTETEYVEVEQERNYFTCELVGTEDTRKKTLAKINELKRKLANYDYIGVKIATGRATKEEYAKEIAQMTEWANEINTLELSL